MTTPTPQYNANTPTVNTFFADWQTDFQQNFEILFKVFGTNHIFNNSVLDGNHTNIRMPEQKTSQQTDVSELAIYTRGKDFTGLTDSVVIRYQNNGEEFQYTLYQIYKVDDTNFFTFLPGNVIVYFGLFLPNLINTNTLSLKPAIAKNISSVNLTPAISTGQAWGSPVQPVFVNKICTSLTLDTNQIPSVIPNQYYLITGNI